MRTKQSFDKILDILENNDATSDFTVDSIFKIDNDAWLCLVYDPNADWMTAFGVVAVHLLGDDCRVMHTGFMDRHEAMELYAHRIDH